jgi:hypothetical protein
MTACLQRTIDIGVEPGIMAKFKGGWQRIGEQRLKIL